MAVKDALADLIETAYADYCRQFWSDGPKPPTLGEFIATRIRDGECWDSQWCCVHLPPHDPNGGA